MPSKRVAGAQKAYASNDIEATKKAHTQAEIKNHRGGSGAEYLGNMVYGALDGIVTTFAVVAGAAGAGLNPGVVLVLGFANLFADGLSMAVGNYLSMKSEQSYYEAERKREEWEVENYPKGERDEIVEIYRRKGYAGKNLETLVELITSKKAVWIDTMMVDELGLVPDQRSPIKAGLYTYAAFLVAGFVPLLIFVVSILQPLQPTILFPIAFLLTFATVFAVGSLRSLVIAKHWLAAGFEMLLIGGLTAIVAYGIGAFIGGFVL